MHKRFIVILKAIYAMEISDLSRLNTIATKSIQWPTLCSNRTQAYRQQSLS